MLNELEKYYQERFILFTSQGWKDLIEDIKDMEAATNKISGVSIDDLRYKQGELAIMNWLLSLEDISKKAYEDLNNADL